MREWFTIGTAYWTSEGEGLEEKVDGSRQYGMPPITPGDGLITVASSHVCTSRMIVEEGLAGLGGALPLV